jgi:hypothetical protein
MTTTPRAARRPRISAQDAEIHALTFGAHISREEAARLACVRRRTIDRWRRDGLVTSLRLPSGEVLISMASLLAHLAPDWSAS